jgi:hypothetical protein
MHKLHLRQLKAEFKSRETEARKNNDLIAAFFFGHFE